jgi:hypothetical protein
LSFSWVLDEQKPFLVRTKIKCLYISKLERLRIFNPKFPKTFLARGFCPYAGVVSSLHWIVWIVEVELYKVFYSLKKKKNGFPKRYTRPNRRINGALILYDLRPQAHSQRSSTIYFLFTKKRKQVYVSFEEYYPWK